MPEVDEEMGSATDWFNRAMQKEWKEIIQKWWHTKTIPAAHLAYLLPEPHLKPKKDNMDNGRPKESTTSSLLLQTRSITP